MRVAGIEEDESSEGNRNAKAKHVSNQILHICMTLSMCMAFIWGVAYSLHYVFNFEDESHRTWRRVLFEDRSTWTLSSPDAVEVPASSSALPEFLAAAALVTSPRSAAAVLLSAAVRFWFSAIAVSFLLSFSVSATVGGFWFCAVACPFAAASSRRRRLMAEEMGPKNDVVLDAGSASKTENVPIQVTSIRLTKDNYLSWSAALEIGITSRGRLSYITGDKPAPSKSDPQWATWALEDSQVKVWIISSVSSDIQPLILRKPTSFDMWTVLAKMYGRKKRYLRTYQIKRSIYSLKQGDLSVAAFYAALKTKWEELDYHVNDEWNCGSDHSLYWEKEWMDRTFLFLGGLRDEFESIRSQILNGDEIPGIEEVYARVESEEQRRQVMHLDTGHGPSTFVSRASGTGPRPARRCTHCNKLGHSVDFCWDIHPEKRLVRGRPPSGRRSPSVSDSSQSNPSSGAKSKLSPDQLKELQANEKGSHLEWVTVDAQPTVARDHFGQVYVRKEKAAVEDVVDEDRTNPNPVISPDDPSPPNEELPIALRKGTSLERDGTKFNQKEPLFILDNDMK
ncbi:hypothetical protein EJ110_NYTH16266 [Nymphaea thermarum]|nr:hypothetical protein EJ110_NYTH16266 [Nymphaea thermarum]